MELLTEEQQDLVNQFQRMVDQTKKNQGQQQQLLAPRESTQKFSRFSTNSKVSGYTTIKDESLPQEIQRPMESEELLQNLLPQQQQSPPKKFLTQAITSDILSGTKSSQQMSHQFSQQLDNYIQNEMIKSQSEDPMTPYHSKFRQPIISNYQSIVKDTILPENRLKVLSTKYFEIKKNTVQKPQVNKNFKKKKIGKIQKTRKVKSRREGRQTGQKMASMERLKQKIHTIESGFKQKKENMKKKRKFSQINKRFRHIQTAEKERDQFTEEILAVSHCKQCVRASRKLQKKRNLKKSREHNNQLRAMLQQFQNESRKKLLDNQDMKQFLDGMKHRIQQFTRKIDKKQTHKI